MVKFITADEAAAMIHDNSLCATAADGLTAWPNEVAEAIGKRFLKEGHPKNIGLIHGPGVGNWTNEKGEAVLSHEGLLTKSIAGYVATNPILVKQILANEVISYLIPQGTLLQIYSEMGRGMPGLLSKVGLGTFMDPRKDGGKCNQYTKDNGEDIVEYIADFQGEEWLWYKAWDINIALIGGTTADRNGNISCEKQPTNLALLSLAQATKAKGGKVIVQVERIVEVGEIHPRMVKIPGIYVDYVVQAQDIGRIQQNMARTNADGYNPAFTGETRVKIAEKNESLPFDMKKVIARRVAMELTDGAIVNMGIGMPQTVGSLLHEQGRGDNFTIISETGTVGGVPGIGLDFGSHWNVESMTDHADHFSFFDGGNLDVGIFGLSEVDEDGNMNVSHLSGKIIGIGGFTNISTNARKSIFMGTFTSQGLLTEVKNGKIHIISEGRIKKFVKQCNKVAYVAMEALKAGRENLYITERCVFRCTKDGMELIEIAPGVDLQCDVLDQMEFMPIIPEGGPKLMDENLFIE